MAFYFVLVLLAMHLRGKKLIKQTSQFFFFSSSPIIL